MELIEKISIENNFRYERKFTLSAAARQEPLLYIKRHPAFFREIFEPRQINNIYLDTPELQYYFDNQKGIADRKKVRIRWYGDTFGKVEKPKLEFKIKKGLVGDKWTFPLVNFEFEKGFTKAALWEIFFQSNLPKPILASLQNLNLALLNAYERTYFLSLNKIFRLTFDEKLDFYRIGNFNNSFLEKHSLKNDFILELKYGLDYDRSANGISKLFPMRLDKSSKYVTGVDFLRGIQY
ncbi:VTC domain-containing protein [Saprospiraceae bacterium]|nr:VTC domain-containing protein [Bacteroidota bacterium]MDB4728031.1 VTC domain-containing protein [Saprospiraceae bacterium]